MWVSVYVVYITSALASTGINCFRTDNADMCPTLGTDDQRCVKLQSAIDAAAAAAFD